jgi:hypothetical protein
VSTIVLGFALGLACAYIALWLFDEAIFELMDRVSEKTNAWALRLIRRGKR